MGYYEDKTRVSNSMLSWFAKSPATYKSRLESEEEEKHSISLERGSMLHMCMLEPEKFVVSDIEKPSDMMCGWVEAVFAEGKGEVSSQLILDAKNAIGAYSNMKDEEKIVTKFNIEGLPYLNFLKQASGKVIMSAQTAYIVDRCKESLLNHRGASMFLEESGSLFETESFNELEIYWEKTIIENSEIKGELQCKSKLDRILIDHSTGTIWLIDIKTTSGSPHGELFMNGRTGRVELDFKGTGFMHSLISYRYYRQMAFYKEALMYWMGLPENSKYYGYVIQPVIIAVQTQGTFETVVYKIPEILLSQGEDEINELTSRFLWHQETGNWDYPKEYYESLAGLIEINIPITPVALLR